MEPLAQDEGKDCTEGGSGNDDCDDGCACTENGDERGCAGIDAADDDTCCRCGLDRLLDEDGLCRSCAADAESDEPDDDDGDYYDDGDYGDDGDCGACDADDGSLAVCDDGEHCKPVTLEVWRHLTPAQRVIVGKAIHNDGTVEASELSRPTKSLAALDKLGVAVGVYDDLSQLQRVVIAPGPWDDDLIEQARKDCPEAFDIEPKGTLDDPQPAAGSLDDPEPDGGAATEDVPSDVRKWRAKIRAELAGVVQPWVEKRRGSPHIERLVQPFLRIAGQLRPSRAVFEAHSLSWESEYDAAGRDVAAAAGCEYDASRADFLLPPQAPAPAAQDQADDVPGPAAAALVVTSTLADGRLCVTVDDGTDSRPYLVSRVDAVAWRASGASSLAHAQKGGLAAVERWLKDRNAVHIGRADADGVELDDRRVVVSIGGEVWGRDDYKTHAPADANATRLRQALRSEHREREVRALLHSFGFRMWSAPVRGAS
jgi:hypothetical protein